MLKLRKYFLKIYENNFNFEQPRPIQYAFYYITLTVSSYDKFYCPDIKYHIRTVYTFFGMKIVISTLLYRNIILIFLHTFIDMNLNGIRYTE